tara:strand:+ start:434 stop:619 length:186 start_codon:yes stop_codon:yes gene_type:complete
VDPAKLLAAIRVGQQQRAEMAAVDVAMGHAQAAMGRFEGSLVRQAGFIQDNMQARGHHPSG